MQPQIQVLIDEIQAERDQQQALIALFRRQRDLALAEVERLQKQLANLCEGK